MSFWDKLKKWVKDAADAVEDFVNDVGDAIGDAVEAVGDAINDALNWVGEKLGIKGVFSWLGGVIKGVFAVIGGAIKGVFGIIGGVLSGVIKIVGGIITLQWNVVLEGLWDIASPIIGTIIVVVGKFIAFVQSLFYIQGFERKLTDQEILQLKRVFKDTLNYYVIRIVEGHSGLFGLNNRAFTLGNTIYTKTSAFNIDLLVHETTHVWQYQQTGARYASDALAAQFFVQDAYNWQKEINMRHKTAWVDFNKEAQAEFFQDIWLHGELRSITAVALITLHTGDGFFFDADGHRTAGYFAMSGNNYTSIANDAVKIVRKEWF